IGLRRVSQPEVDPEIVLRQITRSRFHIADENLSADGKLQPCANPVTIASGPDGSDENGVAAISSLVAKDIRRCADIGDHDIQIAVVVEIPYSERSAGFLQSEARSGRRADAGKLAGSVIPEQQLHLLVTGVVPNQFCVVDDVTISHRQIEVAIVVVIEESCTP